MLKEFTRNLLAYFGIEIRKNKTFKKNKLRNFGVPREEWERKDNGFYLKQLNILVKDLTSPLIRSYTYAKRIADHGKGIFGYDAAGELRLKIQGIEFYINFPDELFVINEVFVENSYNFRTNDPIVIIDVGLNIGATTLFFSRLKNVQKIYTYELFPATYQAALRNLDLNDSSRIATFNKGLGNSNREITLPYSIYNKAVMGLQGLPAGKYDDVIYESVSIIDVAEEISRIEVLEPGIRKVCKMDCEGAEFEILDRLFEKDVIGLIDTYMIEWHDQDTSELEQRFLNNHFQLIKTVAGNHTTGLIYAFKQPQRV